jgi:hypothetical protein
VGSVIRGAARGSGGSLRRQAVAEAAIAMQPTRIVDLVGRRMGNLLLQHMVGSM